MLFLVAVEERARQEKAVSLKELAESRFSVLIGRAGTGKTTLLSVLCGQPDIAEGEVLLLAPTGKARVRMEQAAKDLNLKAYTLAQFLYGRDRFDGLTQSYRLSDEPAKYVARTVIVDEAYKIAAKPHPAAIYVIQNRSMTHAAIVYGWTKCDWRQEELFDRTAMRGGTFYTVPKEMVRFCLAEEAFVCQ